MNLPVNESTRRMNSREAADTGLLTWRENLSRFIVFFAIPFLLCAIGLRLYAGRLYSGRAVVSYLILWWLKPFFDRLILQVISIRFFEKDAGLRRLRRGLWKNIFRGLPGDLLWRRFSPLRSVMMPVRVLELAGKTGKKSRLVSERKTRLKKGGIDYCFLLSLWGIALEAALLAGEIIFTAVITENFIPYLYYFLFEGFPGNIEIFIFAAWCFNYMLVETIYVCMGFSLYINSRVETEGWDLEIKFKKFAGKYERKIIKTAFLVIFFLGGIFLPAVGSAEDLRFVSPEKSVPLEELQIILESPDFGGEIDSWGIRRKNQPEETENTYEANLNLDHLFETLRLTFAGILRAFLIILIAALMIILIIFAGKMYNNIIPKKKNYTMTAVHGIPSEDPKLLLEKSLGFYKTGELRLAWGYCTAAIILSWQLYRGIIFPPNATESECVVTVNKMNLRSEEAKNFGDFVKLWINLAYAGISPPPESFDEAVRFCKSLPQIPHAVRGKAGIING